jgi:hypothetical protein
MLEEVPREDQKILPGYWDHQFGSEMKMKNEPWQHNFDCCVFSSHAP